MPDVDPQAAFSEAFVAALADMPDIHKDKTARVQTKTGGEYSYSYADLSSLLSAVRPVLTTHGLAVSQATDTLADGTVSVTTRIYHKAGHMESFGTLTLAAGSDAKGAGGSITYARRYSLCAALGIAPDEDTDTDGAGGARAPRKEPAADASVAMVSNDQHKAIGALIKEIAEATPTRTLEQVTNDSREWCKERYGVESRKNLTKQQASELIEALKGWLQLAEAPIG